MVQSFNKAKFAAGLSIEERVFELLEVTGLNWTVNKEQLATKDGRDTESYGIFRNDNQQWLGTMGRAYTPFQNHEVAETIVMASDGLGIEVNRGGELAGGRRVFLQAELPEEYVGKSGVKRWVTCTNSHDGSTSIGFGSTNTVIVCENTFHVAYKGISKIRHTSGAADRVQAAMLDLRTTMDLDNTLFRKFKILADNKCEEAFVARLTKKLFGVEMEAKTSEISARKRNQVTAFIDSIEKEFVLEGSTLWGLFNGVTRYTNHVAAPKEEAQKDDYLYSGGGYALSNMAFDEVMSYLDNNSRELVYAN